MIRIHLQFPIEISASKSRHPIHSQRGTHPFHCQNGTEKVFQVFQVFQVFRVIREFNDHLFTPCSPIIVLTKNPYCRIFKNKPHWLFAQLTSIVKLIDWKTFHISCISLIFIVIL